MQEQEKLTLTRRTARKLLYGSLGLFGAFCLCYVFLPYILNDASALTASANIAWDPVSLALDPDYGNGSVSDAGHGDINFGTIMPTAEEGSNVGTMKVIKKTIGITSAEGKYYSVFLSMAGDSNSLQLTGDSNIGINAISGATWNSPKSFSGSGWGYAVPNVADESTIYSGTRPTGNQFAPNGHAAYENFLNRDLTSSDGPYNSGKWAAVAKASNPQEIWKATSDNGFDPSASGDIKARSTFDIYYAAMIGTDILAGQYSNRIVYTAVASGQSLDIASERLMRSKDIAASGDTQLLRFDLTASSQGLIQKSDVNVYLVPHDVMLAANYDPDSLSSTPDADYQKCQIGNSEEDFSITSSGAQLNCVMPTSASGTVIDSASNNGKYDFLLTIPKYGYTYVSHYTDENDNDVESVAYAGLQSKNASGDFYVTTMQGMTSSVCKNTNRWGSTVTFGDSSAVLYDHQGEAGKTVISDSGISEDNNSGSFELVDTRDNKHYLVRRLADGECWMVQNLNLNLADFSGTETLTAANTDLNSKETWDPSAKTKAKATALGFTGDEWLPDFLEDQLGQRQRYLFQPKGVYGNQSGNNGIIYYWGSIYNENVDPTTLGYDVSGAKMKLSMEVDSSGRSINRSWYSATSRNNTSVAYEELDGFVEINSRTELPRSYSNGYDYITTNDGKAGGVTRSDDFNIAYASQYIGQYYDWYAATAESGSFYGTTDYDNVNHEAKDSVCPKGWRLPTYTNGTATTPKSWRNLINIYLNHSNNQDGLEYNDIKFDKISSFPLSITYSGDYYWVNGRLSLQSSYGHYWTSTPSSVPLSRALHFSRGTSTSEAKGYLNPYRSSSKMNGLAVRCVAR